MRAVALGGFEHRNNPMLHPSCWRVGRNGKPGHFPSDALAVGQQRLAACRPSRKNRQAELPNRAGSTAMALSRSGGRHRFSGRDLAVIRHEPRCAKRAVRLQDRVRRPGEMRGDALEVAQDVEMQRAGLDRRDRAGAQAPEMAFRRLALDRAEPVLLGDELPREVEVAGDEDGQRRGASARRRAGAGPRFRPSRRSENETPLRCRFAARREQAPVDDVADMLEVGGEQDQVEAALRVLLVERLAGEAGEVELDRLLEAVDLVVEAADMRCAGPRRRRGRSGSSPGASARPCRRGASLRGSRWREPGPGGRARRRPGG